MVQISRRGTMIPRPTGIRRLMMIFYNTLLSLIRFFFISAMIPSLFLLRFYMMSASSSSFHGGRVDTSGGIQQLLYTPSSFWEGSSSISITGNRNSSTIVGDSRTSGDGLFGVLNVDSTTNRLPLSTINTFSSPSATVLYNDLFPFLSQLFAAGGGTGVAAAAAAAGSDSDITSSLSWNTKEHSTIHGSDLVELYHCDLSTIDWINFTLWSIHLLDVTIRSLQQQYPEYAAIIDDNKNPITSKQQRLDIPDSKQQQNIWDPASSSSSSSTNAHSIFWQDVREEFLLQLLEQYVVDRGLCDFSLYRPTVVDHILEGNQLQELRDKYGKAISEDEIGAIDPNIDKVNSNNDNGGVISPSSPPLRLAFIIIVHQDLDHLASLIQSIHMDDHYIIIHLERRCSDTYKQSIMDHIVSKYNNVVVVQFGTITYATDSVSMINIRIIRWITFDLQLAFDYVFTMDGSVYPLVSSSELIDQLNSMKRNVYLGELLHQGQRVGSSSSNSNSESILDTNVAGGESSSSSTSTSSSADHLLRKRRLILTKGLHPKIHKRLPLSAMKDRSILPTALQNALTHKSTSGNQGIYSHSVIRKLLSSDIVMQLFAMSKYSCCCCIEERNWMEALFIIGYGPEAMEQTSMFQLWGGQSNTCESSMKNAILTQNSSLCYKSEDPGLLQHHQGQQQQHFLRGNQLQHHVSSPFYFYGNETWIHLRSAKQRGFLFARKFSSTESTSMALMKSITKELWTE